MSETTAQAAPVCEHYWAWVSPAGTSRSARICQFCHQPDAKWLSHTVEVDLGHGAGCIDCEFAPANEGRPVTAPVPLVERLAEVLAGHDDPPGWMWSDSDQMVYSCECGDHYVAGPIDVIQEHDVLAAATWHRAHIARALLPVVEQAVAEGRREALREAAREAEERGDIGKDGGYEAWEWLRIRADRIGGAE